MTHRHDGFLHPVPSEITPRAAYEGRRRWLQQAAAGAFGTALTGLAARRAIAQPQTPAQAAPRGAPLPGVRSSVPGATTMDKVTTYKDATNYNNFYEFGTEKSDPAREAHRLKVRPWAVQVDGEVRRPKTFDLDELRKLSAMEERIYRLRCVEGWSMVIPWVGWSLAELIKRVEPTGNAKYVEFITQADPATMPGLRSSVLAWPYREGLRLDEAQHPLTLLAFGMYGEVLPHQNGAPLRLVVPWKYGFKWGKSIVRIRFVERQPETSWMRAAGEEYGFYSNVNPNVDHPRWSQATERRIGDDGVFQRKRPTLMFNGYEAQVGSLYAGMDLKRHF